ncbi:MAG: hypothetical protein ACJ79V_04150 [Myxococcales bacterium]
MAEPPTAAQIREAHAGFPSHGGGSRAVGARAALTKLLWDAAGVRRIPPAAALDRALSALPPGDLFWLSELTPMGPLYLFPTRPFLRALARTIRALGARRVLEVAAGDGHLGRSLALVAPDLKISMTDRGSWEKPSARMSAKEKRELRGVPVAGLRLGAGVERLDAREAIAKHRPDLVLASWLPPGPLLAGLIRSPVRHVLEIGAGSGITGDIRCWRFPHEFLEGPLEKLARCRLDERPAYERHTRVTLYLGAGHEEFAEGDHPLSGPSRRRAPARAPRAADRGRTA